MERIRANGVIKMKRKKNLHERVLVNNFLASLQVYTAEQKRKIYIFKDQDTGRERTASGWDFLVMRKRETFFIEAKVTQGNETVEKKLSDFQRLEKLRITNAGGVYCVLEFHVGPVDLESTTLHIFTNTSVMVSENPLLFLASCGL